MGKEMVQKITVSVCGITSVIVASLYWACVYATETILAHCLSLGAFKRGVLSHYVCRHRAWVISGVEGFAVVAHSRHFRFG